MGKVEMSLQEYDNLKSDLAIYEEIVNVITHPRIDDWSISWYREHKDSTLTITADDIMISVSKTARKLLTELIRVHVDQYIRSHNIEGEFQFDPLDVRVTLGIVNRVKNSEQEASEE